MPGRAPPELHNTLATWADGRGSRDQDMHAYARGRCSQCRAPKKRLEYRLSLPLPSQDWHSESSGVINYLPPRDFDNRPESRLSRFASLDPIRTECEYAGVGTGGRVLFVDGKNVRAIHFTEGAMTRMYGDILINMSIETQKKMYGTYIFIMRCNVALGATLRLMQRCTPNTKMYGPIHFVLTVRPLTYANAILAN